MDEAGKKKLDLLDKKQFHDQAKKLANFHAGGALEKKIKRDALREKFKDKEDDAHSDLTGEELTNRLDEINLERQQELD